MRKTSKKFWLLFCAVFASPHGGFFAVASDDFKESDFHRGNPEKGATSDGIVSSKPILDAPDYLLQLQISVFDKDNNYFKEAMLQALKLLNEIYFTVLNLVSFFAPKK